MAAGYTVKELMEYMGHADLQMVNRYVKLLPQPGEDDAAQRLNALSVARKGYARSAGHDRLRVARSQRLSSPTGISTSRPESTTFSSGCTLRSKWLRLIPSDAAASARVSASRGTECIGRGVARGIQPCLTGSLPRRPHSSTPAEYPLRATDSCLLARFSPSIYPLLVLALPVSPSSRSSPSHPATNCPSIPRPDHCQGTASDPDRSTCDEGTWGGRGRMRDAGRLWLWARDRGVAAMQRRA